MIPAAPSPLGFPPVTPEGVAFGAAALVAGLAIAWIVRRIVAMTLRWRGRSDSSAEVFGRLAGWLVIGVGISAALTITFPSVRPVDILGGVGVISIAAGIAFQTVLGNMFAGIVILARDRFRVGDQILVEQHRGTVVSMRLSSTAIRTFEGRLVLIPNALLHSQIVTVQTGFEHVRTAVAIDLDENTDVDLACRVALEAMADLPQVYDDPAPQALLRSVGAGTLELELRFWSGARQLETREAQHAVIRGVIHAFRARGVTTGSDAMTVEAGPRLLGALGGPRSAPTAVRDDEAPRPDASSPG